LNVGFAARLRMHCGMSSPSAPPPHGQHPRCHRPHGAQGPPPQGCGDRLTASDLNGMGGQMSGVRSPSPASSVPPLALSRSKRRFRRRPNNHNIREEIGSLPPHGLRPLTCWFGGGIRGNYPPLPTLNHTAYEMGTQSRLTTKPDSREARPRGRGPPSLHSPPHPVHQ